MHGNIWQNTTFNAAGQRNVQILRFAQTNDAIPVILLCSDRSQERRTKNNEITTQGEKKEQPAKQTPALATLLYVDWSKENARHQQVNGPPGALPPESVDHGETCQHRMNADRSDLESAGCPFKTSCVVWECRSKSAHQSSSLKQFIKSLYCSSYPRKSRQVLWQRPSWRRLLSCL